MFKYDFRTKDSGEGKNIVIYCTCRKLYHDLFKIIAVSVILGIAPHLLNPNMRVALPVGIIIYLLRVFDNDDKYVIKEILGKD